jgi:GDP-L-fucose synthase
MKKKILIAGGSGLLGSSLTYLAHKKGYKVLSSYFSKIQNKSLKKIYKKFNFLSFNDCLKATKKIDCAILCAVDATGVENMMIGNLYEQNLKNIIIRSNFFEACRLNDVKNVVWVSSSTIYQPKNRKISEKEINLNLKPYEIYGSIGIAYRYIEQLVNYYNEKYKMKIKVVRTSSIYGPYDNFSEQKSHVVPGLIKKVFKDKKLKVWGDKNVVRDFIYVDDLAEAVLRLLNKNLKSPINFSLGQGCSIKKLAQKINKISKRNIDIVYEKNMPSSAKFRVLDNRLSDKTIRINKHNLDQGLKKTIEWYKKNYLNP